MVWARDRLRQHLERERVHALAREQIEGAIVVAHIEQRDQHPTALQVADLLGRGLVDLKDDVGAKCLGMLDDVGTGLAIGGVGEVRA